MINGMGWGVARALLCLSEALFSLFVLKLGQTQSYSLELEGILTFYTRSKYYSLY